MAGVIRRDIPVAARPVSLADVHARADGVLARARDEAARVLAEARVQAAALHDAAARDGHAAGFQQGLDEGRRSGQAALQGEVEAAALRDIEQRVQSLAQALRAALEAFDAEKRRLLAAAESGLVALACEVARRICASFPSLSPEVARGSVQRVIEMARHEEDLRLRVHPAEFDMIERFLPELRTRLGSDVHVCLVPDAEVARGGCILDGRHGTIDATIGTQLQRLADQLVGAARPPGAAPIEARRSRPDAAGKSAPLDAEAPDAGRFQPEAP